MYHVQVSYRDDNDPAAAPSAAFSSNHYAYHAARFASRIKGVAETRIYDDQVLVSRFREGAALNLQEEA